MRLKELLEVIPENYEIGLVAFGKEIFTVTYGTKEDAIMSFAQRSGFIKEQIENMDVIVINPCAYVYCPDEHVFGADMPSLHVKTQILIEIQ